MSCPLSAGLEIPEKPFQMPVPRCGRAEAAPNSWTKRLFLLVTVFHCSPEVPVPRPIFSLHLRPVTGCLQIVCCLLRPITVLSLWNVPATPILYWSRVIQFPVSGCLSALLQTRQRRLTCTPAAKPSGIRPERAAGFPPFTVPGIIMD